MQLCVSLLLSDVATLLEDLSVCMTFIQLSCPKLNISVFNETLKVACFYGMLLSGSVMA